METKMWKMSEDHLNLQKLIEAAQYLKNGELVAFPTETVYGLGANALDPKAVKKIYIAKGRPDDNPLIVHVSSPEQVKGLVSEISPLAYILMEKFWPGPLTLVMPKGDIIPDIITSGLDTVAIRMPEHKAALKLIELADLPIAAPSANISGKPSPTTAQHVYEDLKGKIAGIIDAGSSGVGVESTVLDISTAIPTILRPGGITWEELIEEIGTVEIDSALVNTKEIPRSPGQKYTHYSPNAELFICLGTVGEISEKIKILLEENKGERIGLMLSQEVYTRVKSLLPNNAVVRVLGGREDLKGIAAKLFAALRCFDKERVDVIYAENYPENCIGAALMNRLYKAAGGKTI